MWTLEGCWHHESWGIEKHNGLAKITAVSPNETIN